MLFVVFAFAAKHDLTVSVAAPAQVAGQRKFLEGKS